MTSESELKSDEIIADRKQRREHRARIRDKFLKGMPTGGLCVEIGVWRGIFSSRILEIIEPRELVLIDPWIDFEEAHAATLTAMAQTDRIERIYRGVLKRFETEIRDGRVSVLREKSDRALRRFADASISFAYVDGDHSYEGVAADLAALLPKLRPGGVMAFDDYHLRGWWRDGVIRAIHEFLGQHPSEVRVMSVVGAQFAIEKVG